MSNAAVNAPPVAVPTIDLDQVDEVIREALESSLPELEFTDRRTRNRSRINEAILRAAWRLFLTVGYDQTTVQDITDAADIGKGTFFSHFGKKSDVALYLCKHRRDVVLDLYRRGVFGDGKAASRIERMMVAFARLNADERPEARLMTDIVLRQFFAEPGIMGPGRPAIEDALEEMLRVGIESGDFAKRTNSAAAARLIHAGFYSAKAEWLRPGAFVVPFDLPDQVRDDVRLVLRGIRA
jgi:TetR/AcrR family transcriptional regulator, cholesterol catabolism regulator